MTDDQKKFFESRKIEVEELKPVLVPNCLCPDSHYPDCSRSIEFKNSKLERYQIPKHWLDQYAQESLQAYKHSLVEKVAGLKSESQIRGDDDAEWVWKDEVLNLIQDV